MASKKQSDEQDLPPRKPRRSVIRSLSWKRANKRSRMDDDEQEAGFEASAGQSIDTSINTSVKTHEDVDTTPSSPHCMSDEDAEDTILDDSTASNSKKRKKAGVWKAMKRFFSRKSEKGSKSFTAGDSQSSSGQPQRSVSDPNLTQNRVDRPDVAPLQQVDGAPMKAEVPPKKAVSHGNLLSELRLRQGNNGDYSGETSVKKQEGPILQFKSPEIDWQASPTSTPKLLPGLDMSHDKIKVKPPHRRAPSRRGVASVRHREQDITDGNVIPRSHSVGGRVQNDILVEQPEPSEQDLKVLEQERDSLKERMKTKEEERKRQEEEEDEAKLKQVELEKKKLEQEKLEQHKREQEQLEKEKLEKQNIEEEKRRLEKAEQEKLEQERLEMEKREQERLENEKRELEKLENEKRELEKLENEKREQEKLENKKREQEKLEKEKLEQERLEKEKLEQQETADEEKREQFNMSQTTDFSDLAKSLRSSDNAKESHSTETTELNIEETTSEKTIRVINDDPAVETPGVTLYQNIDTVPSKQTPAALNIEINNAVDDSQTTSDVTVSPLIKADSATLPTDQEFREANDVDVVGGSEEPKSESKKVTAKFSVEVPAVDDKMSGDKTVVTLEKEKTPLLSPHSPTAPYSPASPHSPTSPLAPTSPTSPHSPTTQHSPVRSRRLVIETPEKVYQKPIMLEVQTDETMKNSDGPKGIQRKRPQSMHSRIRPELEQKIQTQDDSNLGVAKLTQAFERSSRSQTISYSERRKKPDVLPKPKPASKPSQSQSLERNYRFPSTTSKPSDSETQKSEKKQTTVVVLDEVPEKADKKKATVLSSPTKKPPGPKPKPLPKPKGKPLLPNATTKAALEDKENVKQKTPSTSSATNGSVKMSDSTGGHASNESKDEQPALPSFWARRNIFSPEQKANNSTPSHDEKPKEKHSPFIQLKTDTCAVCGSKVYQMERFKVKDNIVHRSCIKCSVCKRLLSVGNFIMSQNKIYCKPHEPSVAIPLATV